MIISNNLLGVAYSINTRWATFSSFRSCFSVLWVGVEGDVEGKKG